MSKMNPDGRKYHALAYELAQCYVNIQPCQKCFHPTVHGYVCGFCHTKSPTTTLAQDAAWRKKYEKTSND